MSWLSRVSNLALSALKSSPLCAVNNAVRLTCSGCSIARLNLVEQVRPLLNYNHPHLTSPQTAALQHQQVRYRYVDWRMWRDEKRRRLIKEHAVERLRVNSMRRATMIPKVIKDIADEQMIAFPRDSNISRIRNRCVLTSRPRGVVRRFRLSRIMFRHLADYNKLSGVTRSTW